MRGRERGRFGGWRRERDTDGWKVTEISRFYCVNSCLHVYVIYTVQALYYEERAGNGIGAAVAEKILEVTERIMQESSSAQPVLLRSASVEVSQ